LHGCEIGVVGEEVVRHDVDPKARSWMAEGHGKFLQGLDHGMERGRANVVGAENGTKSWNLL
jgi:hypothetical protein